MKINTLLEKIENDPAYSFVRTALLKVEKALSLYDIRKKEIWISFNGGKDATVILHLLRFALFKKYGSCTDFDFSKDSLKMANVVYFEETNPFEEVDRFVLDQSAIYSFEMLKLGKDMKQETGCLVQKYGMKAVILGERDTDPFSYNRETFSPSDIEKGWEPFMRVNPILDWSYDNVWSFLIDFEIPFCSLYQEGYTHLGNRSNTVKNPFLKRSDDSYKPASEAEGVFENYSRKNYKEAGMFLDCTCIVGLYDNALELEKINKRVKQFMGKSVKSVNFFDIKNVEDNEANIRFLVSRYQNVLFCFKTALRKTFQELPVDKSESIKILEIE